MHSSYFVLVNKEDAENSQDARQTALGILENNNFFGQDGYWRGSKGDWGVVGGRWTGMLSELDIDINNKEAKNYRSTYLQRGYEEDAQILTQKILDILSKERPNLDFDGKKRKGTWDYLEQEVFDSHGMEEFTVADLIKDKKNYLGKYWIVIVDYHC